MKSYLLTSLALFTLIFSALRANAQTPPCTCTDCPVVIPDASPTQSATVQSQIGVTVNGANDLGTCPLKQVCFTLSHTWLGDLSVSLESPNGLHYLLMADNMNSVGGPCGNGQNNAEVCITAGTSNPLANNTNYVCNSGPCSLGSCCLNGNFTMPCGGVTDPVSGAVEAPTCNLNDFNVSGHPANGAWTLTVNDNCRGDVGTIENWSLTFLCGTTSCTNCPNPPTPLIATSTPICAGGQIMLGEFGGQAVSWDWIGPNSYSSTSQNPIIPSATTADNGTYTVTITDAYGCTGSASVMVSVFPALTIGNLSDATVCEWTPVPLNPIITGGSGSYTCQWSPAPGLNNANSCSTVFRSSVAGVYTYVLTVTDNAAGCTATETVTITNQNCCTPVTLTCDACMSTCVSPTTELVVNGDFSGGDTGFNSALNSSCACQVASYCIAPMAVNKCTNSLWQPVKAPDCIGNYMIVDGAIGQIWEQFIPVQPGEMYNFAFDYYPNVSGGGSPTLELWVGNTPILTGIVAPLGTWSRYCASWTYTGALPFNVRAEIRQSVSAQYSDYGIDNISFTRCGSNIMVDAGPDLTICEGDFATLSTTVTGNSGAFTCAWSPPANLNNPNSCSPNFIGITAGTYPYTVTVTDATGCSSTDNITITVLPAPNAVATSNSPVCGGQTLQLNESGGQAVSWQWSGPNSFGSGLQSPTISPAFPINNGTYTVTVTGANGCTNTASTNVTVYSPLNITASTGLSVCEFASVQLSPNITGGSGNYSCSWSPVANLNNPTSCTPNFSATTAGVYPLTLTVTDNVTGCTESVFFNVTVTVCCTPSTPTCNACTFPCSAPGLDLVTNGDFGGGDTGFGSSLASNCACAGGSYCVTTNARNKCTNSLWKPIYSPNCTDNYMVVDGSNGSIWSQTVTPTAGSTYDFGFDFFPNVSDGTSPTLQLRVDGVVVLNNITAPLDRWTRYCAAWTAPAPPASPVLLEIRQIANGWRGDYGIDNIAFTDCGGPPEITTLANTTICENTPLVLTTTITGGAAPYNCQWSPTTGLSNATDCNPTFNSQQAGTYPFEVIVTDDNGCMDTATVTITVERCCTPQALTCNACMTCSELDVELVTNGDFAAGYIGSFTTGLNPVENCNCAGNSFCVSDNARDKCTVSQWQFIQAPDCNDFLIVDGSPGDIWVQNNIPVLAGETYNFSFAHYRDLSGNGGPTLDLRVDNVSIQGGITGTAGAWTTHCATYTAPATANVTLSIVETAGSGFNDYGLDLISFRRCGVPIISGLVDSTICENDVLAFNPIITGGSGNYTCSWSPSANLSNANICNPTFTSATAGTFPYTLTVTDNVSMCSATATVTITVEECCVPISTYCSACPMACTAPGPELVTNGDFAGGDTGFTTGLAGGSNCTCVAASYCIGMNARDKCTNGAWQPILAPDCNNFMIVDGGANGDVWAQSTIPVTAGQTYNFSFSFYPDVSGSGGPTLELRVDNTSILSGITGTSGSWTNHCAAYTASATGTVTLSIVQTAASGFNDFGIDAISFSQCGTDPMVSITPVADFCESDNATLNAVVSGGTPTFMYAWTPSTGLSSTTSPNPTVSGLSAGSHTYMVSVTDGTMCTGTASVTFNVNPDPVVTGIVFNQVCVGETLNLGVSASPTPTGYVWAGPGFSSTSATPSIPSVTLANGGLYSVTVTTADGCTGTASQSIPVNENTGLIFTSYNSPVCEGSTLNLMATGAPMSSYQWNGPSFSSNLQNPSIPGATQAANGGTYILTVTDANGCTRDWPLNVVIDPAPIVSAGSNAPICEGDLLQLFENGGQAVSWSWSGPSFSSSTQNPTIPSATAAMSGTYTVDITDANGCTNSATVPVTVYAPPVISISDETVCEWERLTLAPVITGGSGIYSCVWSPSANLNNANICTPTFQSPTSGVFTYTVTVTDDVSGCTATEMVTITVEVCCTPAMTGCPGCTPGCQSGELLVDGDFESGTGAVNVGSSLPANGGCAVGSYWVTNNARAKCNNSLWDPVTAPDCVGNFLVVDGLNTTIWSQTVNVTAGSTYNFNFDIYPNISGGTSPTLELWVNGSLVAPGITAPLDQWTSVCRGFSALTSGAVLLEIRQAVFGVYSDYGIDNVSLTECFPALQVSTIPDTLLCGTGCVALPVNVTGAALPYTCSWSPSTYLDSPTLCFPTACGMPPGVHTYVVTVTDAAGCVGTASVDITVKANPVAQVSSNSPICEGDDLQLFEQNPSSVAWQWSGPNSFTDVVQNPLITSATTANAGTYTVIITDVAGCMDTASTTVNIFPAITITGLSDATVCEWEPVPLNPVITGGSGSYSCAWSPAPNLNNAGICNPTFKAATAGVYTYTLTVSDNVTGCTASATVTLTAEVCCTPVQTGCTTCNNFCGSNELVLNGNFTGGDTGFSSVLPSSCVCQAGSYCVDDNALDKCANGLWKPIRSPDCVGNFMIVDGANGAVWSQTVNVTSGLTYFFGFDFYPNVSDGTSPTLQMRVNGVPVSGLLTAPLDTWTSQCASWTANVSGNVTIEIRQIFPGFRADYGIDNVSFRECYDLEITARADTTICVDSTVVLTTNIKGGTPPVTCQWVPTTDLSNPNDCNPLFTPTATGTYTFTVTATDDLGCTATDIVTVIVEPCCTLMVDAGMDTTICDMGTAFLNATVTGATGAHSCSWMPTTGLSNPNDCSPTLTGLPNGTYTYTVTVTDAAGCTATSAVNITFGNCCLQLTGPTTNPFNLGNTSAFTIHGIDFWDVNADGVEDLVTSSNSNGTISAHLNIGTATAPNFSAAVTPMGIAAFAPYNIDYNQDGFMDFFAWNGTMLYYFENTTAVAGGLYTYATPVYVGIDIPPSTVNNFAYPAIGDLNNDGLPDVAVAYQSIGTAVNYYENTAASLAVPPTFSAVSTPLFQPTAGGISFAVPEIFDGDCDGDLDLFIGLPGEVQFYENGGTTTSLVNPDLNLTPVVNPFGINGISMNSEFVFPRFVEIDDDNNVELFINDLDNGLRFLFFENACPCPSGVNQFRCAQNVLAVGGNPIVPGLYQGIEELISGSATVGAGSYVDFRAGNSVLLESDFTVELGASFSADIESCSPPLDPGEGNDVEQMMPSVITIEWDETDRVLLPMHLSSATNLEVVLCDMDGHEIKLLSEMALWANGDQAITLETSDLPVGKYWVRLRAENGEWVGGWMVERE